jgi:hypothetical protein
MVPSLHLKNIISSFQHLQDYNNILLEVEDTFVFMMKKFVDCSGVKKLRRQAKRGEKA